MTHDPKRGRRIKQAMTKRNFQKTHALAAKLDVSVAAISRWQNGGQISLQSACSLAECLDVSLDWLLLGRGDMNWHKENKITSHELQQVMSIRLHPPNIKKIVVDLIYALSEQQKKQRHA
ncbi:helix-turn-helix transcriptional regulator (plasmid) [Rhizobium sp. CB3171]|uniref:helix-turn-helix domain-containing protein n=1 Tax=Rhizobium sp. CB3171 TaxID=3039157 RepID=UPI0024B0EE19|nr:helix-turn-helix transcriptional regulator [Rhizobium sp. CB3171]WFU04565.1 helix-turn-helix transcriptional regulator [Rhizobium sp. CB3171]